MASWAQVIPRNVNIQGSGYDTLNVNDQSDTESGLTWYLTGSSVTNSSIFQGPLNYGGINLLTFNGGSGAVTYDVENTAAATVINAGAGNVLVNVSPTAMNLDGLAGALTVNGGGATQLVIDDQDANLTFPPLLTQDTLTSTTLSRLSEAINPFTGFPIFHFASITYGGLAGLTLNTGVTLNLVHVEGTSTATTVNAGTGNALVDVSPTAMNLDGLAGALTVNGGGGTQLIIDDQDANLTFPPVVTQDTLTSTTLSRSSEAINPFTGFPIFRYASITYGGLAGLTLNTGVTLNLVHVEGTSTATTVNAGAGNALVNVSPTAMNLDGLAGALTVNGGGATQLVIDDQDANLTFPPVVTQDTLTSTTLSRLSEAINPFTGFPIFHFASITYGGLAGLTLNTGVTLNLVHVEGTSTATTVNAGAGNVLVDVSPTAMNLDGLAGALAVNGGGATQLIIDDQGNLASKTYSITGVAFQRTGSSPITYGGLSALDINGSQGADRYNLSGTSTGLSTTITGGNGINTLAGPDVADTWEITGPNAGTLGQVSFSGIANLIGGTGADTFVFASTGSMSGTIDGGAGANALDYSGDGGLAATVNLAALTATKTGGFANIQNLVGSTSAADGLIGPNATSTWTLTGINAGTVGALGFSGVENLTGGTAADTFKFTAGSVTGKIDGGAGANALDYSGDGGLAATVNLATSTATRTGGFGNIQKLVGSTSAADSLIGPNAASTWTLTGINAGTVGAFGFSAIESPTGGAAADTFKFAAAGSVTGKIDGGAGANTLDYSGDGGAAATVNLAASTATRTGGFANVQSLVGSTSAADKLIGPNAASTWSITAVNGGSVAGFSFSAIENLTSGSANDLVRVSNGKGVAGKIDGGGGSNTLDYSLYTTGVTVNLTTGTATGIGAIANFQNVTGSPVNDTITGGAGNNTISGNGGTDVLNGGGSGTDLFILGTTQGAGTIVTGAAPATPFRVPTSPTPGRCPPPMRATSMGSPTPGSPT